jgi:hypothetical protein
MDGIETWFQFLDPEQRTHASWVNRFDTGQSLVCALPRHGNPAQPRRVKARHAGSQNCYHHFVLSNIAMRERKRCLEACVVTVDLLIR